MDRTQQQCGLLALEKSRDSEIVVNRCIRKNASISNISECQNCSNFRDTSLDFLLLEEEINET
jgi:hypothetical protein